MQTLTIDHDARAERDICASFSAFKPPRRIPVSQSAAENLFLKQPGGVPGLWNPAETPYMIEPMDMLGSRRHEAVCFVGPARTGKTAALLLGYMAHAVVNDPGDMLMIQMTQDKAREFSKTDIDRAILYSENIKALMGGRQDDNTHDKLFRHGMWLRIAWPTASNVAGTTYRYALITDIDRMENAENVDGEGPLYNLALKRTQTFMSRGMCLVESSPGIELTDPHWAPVTPHEAPPTTGVLGIYNQSDRRRLYWKCLHCDAWFEASPGLNLFRLPSEDVLLEIVREADLEAMANEHNRIVCPHCHEAMGPRSKPTLNARHRWLADGLMLTKKDELVGTPMTSSIAGYWLGGVAAAYQSWRSIILRYLQGLRAYALNGSEQTLKATTNTDQGMPYMPMHLREAASASSDPGSRKEDFERYVLPDETRFVVATVDIQGGKNARFVVQVHAVGPHKEKWIVDRFNITESEREGVGGGKAPIDPARYVEDWDTITEQVVRKTYRTKTDGVEMRVKLTVVDSGGEEGVTERAYAWFRKIRKAGMGLRVMLIKGKGVAAKTQIPLIRESLVGNRNPKEKGDIPLYTINSNMVKDTVNNGLRRVTHGPGYVHIPKWLPQSFIDELNSEVRNQDGTWTQVRARNEAFDLLVYCEAGCLRLGVDKIVWDRAPEWARPIAENSERITREERRALQANEPVQNSPQAPVQQPAPLRRGRRVGRSSYLGG